MIKYRLATQDDNQQLLELTAASGMTGKTSLRIDRKPDFFKLLNMRGDSKVFVAFKGNIIVGSLSVSLQQVYIGGQIFPVQYIGDFKVAETFRGHGIGIQLCNELEKYTLSINADLVFLTVVKGNIKPLPFFKGRPNIPDFQNIGTFVVHQFIGTNRKDIHPEYKIESTSANDEVIEFLNKHYCKFELGSVITKDKLLEANIFTIHHNKNIVAAMCLVDTMNAKQNVIVNLSWKMKYLLKFINTFHRLLRISKMPLINEPVLMMYIKYFAVSTNEKKLTKLLINHARNIVYEKGYSFVSLGLHEKDPLNNCIVGLRRLTFNSIGMFLSLKDNRSLMQKVKQGIPFEDYSLV